MKRLLCILLVLAAMLSLICCSPKETPGPSSDPVVSVDPSPSESEDPASEDPSSEAPESEDPESEDPVSEDPGSEDPASEDPGPEGPTADILDVIFQPDGSAINGAEESPLNVRTFRGSALTTYYNSTYDRWVAHFNHGVASGITDGFYKVDYSARTSIRTKIAESVTMEALVRLDADAPTNYETKFFSSMQSGGLGFLIPTAGNGGSWTWLPNVSPSGASNWVWTKSGVKPVVGRYYHLVGTWDKEEGSSCIYVDGELKGRQTTTGDLNFPGVNSCWWFCIGGDPNASSTAESAWNGDIVLARIYGRALDEEEVAELWSQVNVGDSGDNFTLSNIEYLSPCIVRPGYNILVYADGLQSGDKVSLTSMDGERYDPQTVIYDRYAKVKAESSIPSGTYSMLCERGGAVYPLGTIEIEISDDAQNDIGTRVIAHRGFHDGSSGSVRPENSIAALRAAQDLGVYGSEFDVWMTTDGDLFINHDGVLGGVTIQNSTTAVVSALKLSNGESIPTLEQYLDQGLKCETTRLVLEIKTHSSTQRNNDVTDKCVALVKEKGLVDRVDWIAFDYEICKRIHAALPDAPVAYLSGGKTPAALYADGIMGLDYSYIQQNWIGEAHELGMTVNVWTINSPQDMLKYIAWGVDYITTNSPDVCQRLCETTWITAD